ncbi:BamA/TamA family outer membrane protein [Candidatus Neomarinimicrobiota bacterium]
MIKLNKVIVVVFVVVLSVGIAIGQDDVPTGWSFGGVPAIAYNSDTGFLYGAILNIFNYGDGSKYPEYMHSTYLEWSRTTKGSGKNIIQFDSKYLLPWDLRITADLSYLTEAALPFYGFNGYESKYLSKYEDDEDVAYKSRVYYQHERDILKFTANFQKQILKDYNLRGLLGFGYHDTKIATVDIESLNDGKDDADKLPEVDLLYDTYLKYGAILEDEAKGGLTNSIKIGLVFDTRDNEPNPMSGMWTEALITTVPNSFGNDFSYSQFSATHRQYFTIIDKNLSFAYRLAYQGVIDGQIPFFMLPFYQGSYKTEEGYGGAKTLRGVLKNRIVGNSVGFANFEMRWKFLRTKLAGQNLYLALNGFVDAGQVLERYDNPGYEDYYDSVINAFGDAKEDALHFSYGGGFRIALNENFIIAIDYGMAGDEQDGNSGLYIGLGYLY